MPVTNSPISVIGQRRLLIDIGISDFLGDAADAEKTAEQREDAPFLARCALNCLRRER